MRIRNNFFDISIRYINSTVKTESRHSSESNNLPDNSFRELDARTQAERQFTSSPITSILLINITIIVGDEQILHKYFKKFERSILNGLPILHSPTRGHSAGRSPHSTDGFHSITDYQLFQRKKERDRGGGGGRWGGGGVVCYPTPIPEVQYSTYRLKKRKNPGKILIDHRKKARCRLHVTEFRMH